MTATAREQIKGIQAAQLSVVNDFNGSDGDFAITNTEVKKLHRRTVEVLLNDANTANQACAEKVFFLADNGPVRVISARVTSLTISADNTDYATWTLARRTAGGAATTIATRATTVAGGAMTTLTPSSMTVTVANADLALNDALTIKCVKTGAGQKIAGATDELCSVVVVVEEI